MINPQQPVYKTSSKSNLPPSILSAADLRELVDLIAREFEGEQVVSNFSAGAADYEKASPRIDELLNSPLFPNILDRFRIEINSLKGSVKIHFSKDSAWSEAESTQAGWVNGKQQLIIRFVRNKKRWFPLMNTLKSRRAMSLLAILCLAIMMGPYSIWEWQHPDLPRTECPLWIRREATLGMEFALSLMSVVLLYELGLVPFWRYTIIYLRERPSYSTFWIVFWGIVSSLIASAIWYMFFR